MNLRTWQREALERWIAANRRGMVEVVTGGGKTIFALACVKSLWEVAPQARVLIVVPTVVLQDQWLSEVRENLTVEVQPLRRVLRSAGKVLVATMDTARSLVQDLTATGDWLLIVDECHRAASEVNSRIFEGRYIATLGLSATPERQYDDGFERVLEPGIGPVVLRYSHDDAVRDGIVVPFELRNYRVPMTIEEEENVEALTHALARESSKKSPDTQKIRTLLLRRARHVQMVRSRVPAACALVAGAPESRALVFHESVEHAAEIDSTLAGVGIRTGLYHSALSDAERRKNIHLFRTGALDCLVTCRALDEGLNVPRADFAVIASSTAGTRQRIQRLGRVLRPHPRKSSAVVATLYAHKTEQQRLLDEATRLADVSAVRWYRMGGP